MMMIDVSHWELMTQLVLHARVAHEVHDPATDEVDEHAGVVASAAIYG
jgi:hypothetical protein